MMGDKLTSVSVKYAVERTRSFTTVKQPTDRKNGSPPPPPPLSLTSPTWARTLPWYKTQWFLISPGLRCSQHKRCRGGLFE
ncbi:hypothetical protein, unknown function [Leishmania tarentolae]|uniref:Uncharacterized protein n=1 Tax=Leishmania tarentolae TaxID=5689 RepID=A0A640KFW9_LEITA|nr:hypothetical protein, unknown function [Leishmania tarentolae]